MKKKADSLLSLSKFVAHAGIASRRKVVDLICQGLIKVNGKSIKEPGYKIQPNDTVTYHDQKLKITQKKLSSSLISPRIILPPSLMKRAERR